MNLAIIVCLNSYNAYSYNLVMSYNAEKHNVIVIGSPSQNTQTSQYLEQISIENTLSGK